MKNRKHEVKFSRYIILWAAFCIILKVGICILRYVLFNNIFRNNIIINIIINIIYILYPFILLIIALLMFESGKFDEWLGD